MAVQRVEWQCPGRQRKFAIPSREPRPKLCPDCLRNAPQKRPAASTAALPAQAVEPDLEFAGYPAEPRPVLPGPDVQPSRPVKRRRYQELRTLSVVLKILAALIGLFTIVLLAENARLLMAAEADALRRHLAYYCFGILIGGSSLALVIYAFAVLLLIALDLEYNTRSD